MRLQALLTGSHINYVVATVKNSFHLLLVVWCFLRGFPWWPRYVTLTQNKTILCHFQSPRSSLWWSFLEFFSTVNYPLTDRTHHAWCSLTSFSLPSGSLHRTADRSLFCLVTAVGEPANADVFPVVASVHPKSRLSEKPKSKSQNLLFGWRGATTTNAYAFVGYREEDHKWGEQGHLFLDSKSLR